MLIFFIDFSVLVGIGPWPGGLTNYCPSVLDTVGWVIWHVKIVPDMTYNVFGGTLNPTLPSVLVLLFIIKYICTAQYRIVLQMCYCILFIFIFSFWGFVSYAENMDSSSCVLSFDFYVNPAIPIFMNFDVSTPLLTSKQSLPLPSRLFIPNLTTVTVICTKYGSVLLLQLPSICLYAYFALRHPFRLYYHLFEWMLQTWNAAQPTIAGKHHQNNSSSVKWFWYWLGTWLVFFGNNN